jgi:hypothetical protein
MKKKGCKSIGGKKICSVCSQSYGPFAQAISISYSGSGAQNMRPLLWHEL